MFSTVGPRVAVCTYCKEGYTIFIDWCTTQKSHVLPIIRSELLRYTTHDLMGPLSNWIMRIDLETTVAEAKCLLQFVQVL